jgi:hypothetical protein
MAKESLTSPPNRRKRRMEVEVVPRYAPDPARVRRAYEVLVLACARSAARRAEEGEGVHEDGTLLEGLD